VIAWRSISFFAYRHSGDLDSSECLALKPLYAEDLKSSEGDTSCGFDSHRPHFALRNNILLLRCGNLTWHGPILAIGCAALHPLALARWRGKGAR